ncbi:hypothetical protein WL28_25915 [Burkholderia ubonensis]|nr:hypothetical protein WL28_25915 [Burkholderia ubonensis]OJB16229.1 hypothetical protein BGV54_23080 [Burkholderia ubonensis]
MKMSSRLPNTRHNLFGLQAIQKESVFGYRRQITHISHEIQVHKSSRANSDQVLVRYRVKSQMFS